MAAAAIDRNASRRRRLADMLAANRIIPVITIERVADAVPLARALVAGGIRALEITLRTPAAFESAGAIIAEVPEAIVGVGTVLNAGDLVRAERIGAQFALSPGASPALLAAAGMCELPFVPGVATASELMAAIEAGFSTVKLFPAVPIGGIAALRSLAGPFPEARFCPTGGIGEANFAQWLEEPNVLAVGGSWLAPPGMIARGDWAAITAAARRAVATRGAA